MLFENLKVILAKLNIEFNKFTKTFASLMYNNMVPWDIVINYSRYFTAKSPKISISYSIKRSLVAV